MPRFSSPDPRLSVSLFLPSSFPSVGEAEVTQYNSGFFPTRESDQTRRNIADVRIVPTVAALEQEGWSSRKSDMGNETNLGHGGAIKCCQTTAREKENGVLARDSQPLKF